jgi:hypothetical protein
LDEGREDLVFTYDTPDRAHDTVKTMLSAISEQKINIVNKESYRFFNEPMDKIQGINESASPEDEALLEYEMFNVNRRDVTSFSDFLKKAEDYRTVTPSGKDLNHRKFQLGFMHEIQRDPTFKHPAFDSLYKSFGTKDPKKRKEQEGGNYTTPGAFPAAVGSF